MQNAPIQFCKDTVKKKMGQGLGPFKKIDNFSFREDLILLGGSNIFWISLYK